MAEGIYIIGTEDDLSNSLLLLVNFLAYRAATKDFKGKSPKTVHVLNATIVRLDKTSESFKYPEY